MFMMVAYLLAGALHGLCDLDVTNPGGNTPISMSIGKDEGRSSKGVVAEHHCHGCFSVSVPAPVVASALIEPASIVLPLSLTHYPNLIPGIEPPPPKILA